MTARFVSPLTAKLLVIGGLTLVLLLPLAQVRSLVYERQGIRQSAVDEIGAGWGGRQVVGPPILAVPFETVTRETYETASGQMRERIIRTQGVRHALAAQARVEGSLQPEMRHLGIYYVPVYQAQLAISGTLDHRALEDLIAEQPGRTVDWAHARLILPVADVKGIREIKVARWNGADLNFEPSAYGALAAVGAQVDARGLVQQSIAEFRFELELAGSQSLRVLPLARSTQTRLTSTWPHPNFSAGEFLPARYSLDAQGFDAHWQVLELNRSYPQSWADDSVEAERLLATAFGVDLYQPVDTYQRNERTIKYALLFIAITLMSIFLWEQLTAVRLHGMHYLLVGLALCVFYLLLLALSEHMTFGHSYLIAASALVGLIAVYLAGVLRSRWSGALAGVAVASVYALLYLLVLSEQYALLLGALLVFTVLAIIMLATRRLDWRRLSTGAAAEA